MYSKSIEHFLAISDDAFKSLPTVLAYDKWLWLDMKMLLLLKSLFFFLFLSSLVVVAL